ncbi:DNA-binding transcriptional regulator, MerR family [Cnuella takakiae]|uniref:DNA-binding transcriptional regulator, MerR family n=1 Tax=Cnuella takakiae TaxID=1302690 RepID=A0A1M5DSQ8_9BACT|nr:MerR family transcriptional regulator [Cnuella takakiae]OLY93884.1 hypothetical protein BUE76_19870 [Cnuella takakiae]SHF69881.1 DNA-binding transcriptional regulator, MerR family [Cnuella takakiae]
MGFSIKELETISGIKAHTIRIWEQRYNFLKPERTATNIRTYSNEELKTLLTVALLNKHGYKISRIDEMDQEQRRRTLLQLGEANARTEYLVNELIGFMVDLKALEFELILNDYIREFGMEATVTTLIFSFLEKVGILWQTDRINPAQEHIVSNLIRQKIICGIEGLPFPERKDPLFLLFLPEEEFHEMGLLFVYYLLRKKSIPVIYLGANVPVKDIGYIVDIKKPDYLYMHLTAPPRQVKFEKLLNQLSQYPATTLLSGYMAELGHKPYENIRMLTSLHQVLEYLEAL